MSVFRKIAAACLLVPFASWPAFAQAPKLEKTHLAIAVGGSISQMNKVAYTMALHRK